MNIKLKNELLDHIINTISDQELTDFEELHYHAFNEDYYIIGYYQASEWLKKHDIGEFEAIADIIEWERDNFGEVTLKSEDINSEKIVNMYVYFKGEELLSEFDLEQSPKLLLEELQEAVSK